jgi:hypothetical protein
MVVQDYKDMTLSDTHFIVLHELEVSPLKMVVGKANAGFF